MEEANVDQVWSQLIPKDGVRVDKSQCDTVHPQAPTDPLTHPQRDMNTVEAEDIMTLIKDMWNTPRIGGYLSKKQENKSLILAFLNEHIDRQLEQDQQVRHLYARSLLLME
jgi:hypothetical protein